VKIFQAITIPNWVKNMVLTATMEEILKDENINTAIAYLKTKKNATGDDHVWLHELDQYWRLNKETISKSLLEKRYRPQVVHEKVITMANGKHRKIALMSSVDRLLLRAILQVIEEPCEKMFSSGSFAYQTGRGIDQAIRRAADYIESGRKYVVELDVKNFFDTIEHNRLLGQLKKLIGDERLYVLLEKYIVCTVESDYKLVQKNCGIIQGSPLSPLLSNLYLTEFDYWLEQQGYAFVRFADDINIYVTDLQEGTAVLSEVTKQLALYNLEVPEEKRGVYQACSRIYLGYIFEENGTSVIVKKYKPRERTVFSKWHKNAIEKMDHDYYIVNDGILTKRDFTILFENEEKKFYIPVETSDSINIYSNIELSANFIELLNHHHLNLNIFNQYGVYLGSFYANNQRNRMKCLVKQVEIYQDEKKHLDYAKKLEMASLHNLRCTLRYHQKQHASEMLKENIEDLSKSIKNMNEAGSVSELLLLEARSRQKYYQCFNEMLHNDEFHFVQRTKRPPKDPLNAMISFGNVYLYQKIAQMIYKTSIDIRISFVHSAYKRYENLNLDLADVFKPIIVDRVICTLINKKMISAGQHFEKQEKDGIYLTKEGKRIFLQELNRKMQQIITVDHQQYTYERLLYQEVRNLERSLLENEKYKPFKYQM